MSVKQLAVIMCVPMLRSVYIYHIYVNNVAGIFFVLFLQACHVSIEMYSSVLSVFLFIKQNEWKMNVSESLCV